jgi:hypothetical protein
MRLHRLQVQARWPLLLLRCSPRACLLMRASHRSSYVACWVCDPPPCKQQAFYECAVGAGSFFNEDTQTCEWLRLRVPPFDCPVVRCCSARRVSHALHRIAAVADATAAGASVPAAAALPAAAAAVAAVAAAAAAAAAPARAAAACRTADPRVWPEHFRAARGVAHAARVRRRRCALPCVVLCACAALSYAHRVILHRKGWAQAASALARASSRRQPSCQASRPHWAPLAASASWVSARASACLRTNCI